MLHQEGEELSLSTDNIIFHIISVPSKSLLDNNMRGIWETCIKDCFPEK
jgi:hypothetical protein